MNIAIITGGTGSENDVSFRSAEYILKNINFAKITTFDYPKEYKKFLDNINDFDIVIPIIHGEGGEDGKIQEKLDGLNVSYLFSKPEAHKKCFDKFFCKNEVSKIGILSPKTYTKDSLKNTVFPLIAKPISGGSSINLHFIENQQNLDGLGFSDDYIYEQYISGREFTIGVIESKSGLQVLPIMEVKTNKAVFNYDDKYSDAADDIEIFPIDLSMELECELKNLAEKVHKKLGLRHISRTDVIVSNSGKIYFLEVNTIPGMTEKSWIPKMIKKAGLSFSEILKFWCEKSIESLF